MRKTVAIIFAGGRAAEMSVLTFRRPKSAVYFGGIYRMIDFALTNVAHTSAVQNVGVLTQYRPSSLIDHIGSGLAWDLVGSRRSLRILPPFVGLERSEWYRGTADALYQNLDFLDQYRADDVLIVSGDHAYHTSYEPLLRFHMEHAADVTLGFTPVQDNPSRFGIGELNADSRVVSYTEKPKFPRSNLASMTVYVFRREVLMEELSQYVHTKQERKSFHIYDDILPTLLERRKVFGWVHHGTWDYARTLDSYWQAHQDLLGEHPRLNLANWHVRTDHLLRRAAPPSPTTFRQTAVIHDSQIAGGCDIAGQVERSVLSPYVSIGQGAIALDSRANEKFPYSYLWEPVVELHTKNKVHDKQGCQSMHWTNLNGVSLLAVWLLMRHRRKNFQFNSMYGGR